MAVVYVYGEESAQRLRAVGVPIFKIETFEGALYGVLDSPNQHRP